MSAENWIVVILGVWLAVSGLLDFSPAAHLANGLLVGAVVTLGGIVLAARRTRAGSTAALLGLWVVIAAFVHPLQTDGGHLWNSLLVGVALAIVGLAARVQPPVTR